MYIHLLVQNGDGTRTDGIYMGESRELFKALSSKTETHK